MLIWSDPNTDTESGMNKLTTLVLSMLVFAQLGCAASDHPAQLSTDQKVSTVQMEPWVSHLLDEHRKVLSKYQKDHDATQAFIDLQRAGIAKAIENQPKGISKQAYVSLLNDFAYFRYESTAFKTDAPQYVHLKDFSFVGSERMLRYDDIPNATMRLNRLCEAKHILQKVIQLEPDRAVAYLNLGDVYWRSAEYAQKIGYFGDRKAHQPRAVWKRFQCADEMTKEFSGHRIPDHSIDFFNAYDTYKLYLSKMVEQGKADKVSERIRKLTSRKLGYTVIQDDGLELGDQTLCIDYEKALNALSDNEIDWAAAHYYPGITNEVYAEIRKEMTKKGLVSSIGAARRGDITRYASSFKRIPFSSLPMANQKTLEKPKLIFFATESSEHPDQIFERKGNIYVDTRAAFGVLMIHTDPEVQKWQGMWSRRCIYQRLNFERKFTQDQ